MQNKIEKTPQDKGLKTGLILGLIIDFVLLFQDWLFSGTSLHNQKQCGFIFGSSCSWNEFFKMFWYVYLIIGVFIVFIMIVICTFYFLMQNKFPKK